MTSSPVDFLMNNTTAQRTLFLCTLLLLSVANNTIAAASLYLQPSESGQIVASLANSAAILQNAKPVDDATLAEAGWHVVTFKVDFSGYIEESKVSKNYTVEDGASIYSKPNTQSQIITLKESEDQLEPTGSEGIWIRYKLSKTLPTYFKKQTTPAQQAIALTSENTLALPSWNDSVANRSQRTNRSELQQGYHFNPNLPIGEATLEELAPENVEWSGTGYVRHDPEPHLVPRTTAPSHNAQRFKETTDNDDFVPIMVEKSTAAVSELPRAPQIAPGTPTRTLNGKLVRKIQNSGPRYPLQLQSRSKGRLAYIDMSKLFISDLRPFLNRQVYVTGEVFPLVPGSSELVIMARTIRVDE